MKKIILANPRGFCAGVDRAITIVEKALEKYGAPVYVRHEVVHNKYVVDGLKESGAIFIEEIKDVPEGSILIYTIIMIGHKGHPEVEGTMGQVPNQIYLIENEADIDSLPIARDIEKIAVVTQTTLSVDETKSIIDKLKSEFPHLRLPKNEDICYATQNRQDAVKEMAKQCDAVLVIGSKNSSNSNRLKELAENLGVRSYLIDFDYEIKEEWLANVTNVGVTAGASAPEVLVEGVIKRLGGFGYTTTETLNVVEEHMVFALPSELRS